MNSQSDLKNWQDVILREWRNTDDEEYAQNLFDLVMRESATNSGQSLIFLLCVLGGALAGLSFLAAVINSYVVSNSSISVYLMFLAGGTVFGAFFGVVFWVRLDISWPQLLKLFTPKLTVRFLQLWLGHLNSLTLISMVLFILGFLLGVVINGLLLGLTMTLGNIPEWLLSDLLLGIFGLLLFGVALFGGMWIGHLILQKFGAVLGYICGLGFVLGDIFVLYLAIQQLPQVNEAFNIRNNDFSISSAMQMYKGFFVLGATVVGLNFLMPNTRVKNMEIKTPLNVSDYKNVYAYRSWWTWWRRQPTVTELEMALRQAIGKTTQNLQTTWQDALDRLEKRKDQKNSAAKLIAKLQNKDWVERFIARQLLRILAQEAKKPPATTASQHLCKRCFVRYHTHQIPLSATTSYTHYGCRVCREVDTFLDWSNPVVAVIDSAMWNRQIQHDAILYINWLKHRALFDFDRVEILKATDEDVERFAVLVGNDTDEVRKPRYQDMICTVASDCDLSENTIRILQNTFGQIKTKEPQHVN